MTCYPWFFAVAGGGFAVGALAAALYLQWYRCKGCCMRDD